MRFGLGVALLAISWGAYASQGENEAKMWAEVQLSTELRQRFISDEKCYRDLTYLKSCISALNAAQNLVNPQAPTLSIDDNELNVQLKNSSYRIPFEKQIEQLTTQSTLPAQMIWGYAINAHLQVYDPYAEIAPMQVERQYLMQKPEVKSFLVDKSIGVLSIGSFDGRQTCAQTQKELEKLIFSGAHKIILDLRENLGGNRLNALCVAGLFLGLKRVIGVRKSRPEIPDIQDLLPPASKRTDIVWMGGTIDKVTDLPVDVWINHNSASATEILAGALQDQKRATIIGQNSRGKARAQLVRPIPGTAISLSVTTEELVLPSGRTYQSEGLFPDIEADWHKIDSEKWAIELAEHSH